MAEQLSASQRTNIFNLSTRQNYQMLAKKSVTGGAQSIEFEIPKARYLSNIWVKVKAIVNMKHASKTSVATEALEPFRIFDRITLDLNNGFAPYTATGEMIGIYNALAFNGKPVLENVGAYRKVEEHLASATGIDNTLEFCIQLPLTLNKRDTTGLILAQNQTTLINARFDVTANGLNMFRELEKDGFTMEIKKVEVEAMTETFSIPSNPNGRPDISAIKLCIGRTDSITAGGQHIIKMVTGSIYRKMIMYITDENGAPVDTDFITSNIEVLFNQADVNYAVSPTMLRAINNFEYGFELPKGVYVLDFSNNGIPNYGGSRDLIDSGNLSELWVRFTTTDGGKVHILNETISRLTAK